MKNNYLVIGVITVAVLLVAFLIIPKKSNLFKESDCSKYSNKDGYTGCMSIEKGNEKKCKFKVDNKINEATQQMEFTYFCFEK